MKYTKKFALVLALLTAAFLMVSCTAPAAAPVESQPTIAVAALKAEIASTVIAEITQQAPAQPEAPAEEQPVVEQPTQTPWVITATPDPAQEETMGVVAVLPTATKKPATSGGAVWPTVTPTYYTDVARCANLQPASYSVVSPGYDFDTVWTIENTGHRQWNTSFYYKMRRFDGTEFGPVYVGALTVGDTFNAVLDTTAPHTPGNYVNTLYLVNDDGVTFFTSAFVFTVK